MSYFNLFLLSKRDENCSSGTRENQHGVHLGMLTNIFSRHLFSFICIVLASVLLYPAAQGEKTFLVWVLLSIILLAAVLTIKK